MTRRWYAVIVQTHMDVRFARDLGERGYETHVALTYSREKYGSKSWVEAALLLSPYVWVCVDASRRHADGREHSFDTVKQTYGYLGVVSLARDCEGDYQANAIPEEVIRGLRLDQIEDFEAATRRVRRKESIWQAGDQIQVIGEEHPFVGYQGVVTKSRHGSLIAELGPQKLPIRLQDDDVMLVKPFSKSKMASAA